MYCYRCGSSERSLSEIRFADGAAGCICPECRGTVERRESSRLEKYQCNFCGGLYDYPAPLDGEGACPSCVRYFAWEKSWAGRIERMTRRPRKAAARIVRAGWNVVKSLAGVLARIGSV